MAWSAGTYEVAGTSKASGTTLSLSTLVSGSSGEILIVALVFDNLSTTTPTVSLSKPAGETNSWTITEMDASSATAAASVRGAVAWIQMSTTWSSHNVTATFSGAITAKVMGGVKFPSGGSTTLRGTIDSGPTGATPVSIVYSGARQPQNGDLVIAFVGCEINAAPAADTDTTNGSWSSGTGTGFQTTGGNTATNVAGRFQYKIVTATGDQQFDTTPTNDTVYFGCVLQPAAAGLGGTLGVTTETDASQALGKRKTKAITFPSETDAAQALTPSKRRALALVTETETAQALGRRKIKAVGTATETDTALPITKGSIIVPVGTATETDSAISLGRVKRKVIGVTTETDSAIALGKIDPIWVAVGTATETETAIAVGRRKVKAVPVTTETDDPQPFGKIKRKALPVVTSIEVALSIGDSRAIFPAIETDTAQPFGRRKVQALPVTTETETAQPLGRAKVKAIGTALETDQAVSFGGVIRVSVGTATESDTALALGRIKRLAVGTATETDTAQPFGRIKIKALPLALEFDAALLWFAVRKIKAVSLASETDAAQPVGRTKVRAVGTATETDAAQSITRLVVVKIIAVGTAVETETAIPVGKRKIKPTSRPAELSQAQSIRPAHRRILTPATETETALSLGKRKFKRVLGINVVETAMPISVPMYSFEPPAFLVAFRQEHAWPEKRTWLGLNDSFSIVRKGGVLTQVKSPNAADLAGVEGRDWFLGGRVYTVPHPVAKELIAAGFTPELI